MGNHLDITAKRWFWRQLREGRQFRKILSYINKVDWFSKKEIAEMQKEKLESIIRHSYMNVPYYRRLFDDIGFGVNGRFNVADIKKIQMLTKDEILEDPYRFISKKSKRMFLRESGTTGTTGTPIRLFRDLYSINFENATLWKQRYWAGVKKGDRKVTLRGDIVIPPSVQRPPFWKYDYLNKELVLSSLHISRENVRYYVDILKGFRPSYIEAYPDSLYILALFIKESGLKGVSFKSVITASDTLYDYKKKLIEEVFNCKVYDFYGSAERVIAIATCPNGNYHILPEYGFAEFLECDDGRQYKEIVGTSFINMSMPLIRYRTGDVIELSSKNCPCGRKSQVVKKILGRRLSNFVITPDRRFISLIDCIFKGMSNIIEAQIIQDDYDSLKVRLVPGKDFNVGDENMLEAKIKGRVGDDIKIYIEKVDFISRAPHGKFRAVISNIVDKEI